ncbi:hypothetical protein LSAT2_004992 [Lamellibrachia satsuma]|nr:hypothetical protein LSAT2_004992 [Lamellibrachia satsuma]
MPTQHKGVICLHCFIEQHCYVHVIAGTDHALDLPCSGQHVLKSVGTTRLDATQQDVVEESSKQCRPGRSQQVAVPNNRLLRCHENSSTNSWRVAMTAVTSCSNGPVLLHTETLTKTHTIRPEDSDNNPPAFVLEVP